MWKRKEGKMLRKIKRPAQITFSRFFRKIRGFFITGLLVLIPIFITLWVTWWIYENLTAWAIWTAENIPALEKYDSFWMEHSIRIISLLLIVAVFILVGQFARITVGDKLIRLAQKILMHLPIISFIYSTCKQVGDAIGNSASGSMFSKVVMFEYPNKGTYAIGFMTNENEEAFEVTEKIGSPVISVFMPTTPNPTSGFLFLIPRERCTFLDMSVSDAMKFIVSVGAVVPRRELPVCMKETKKQKNGEKEKNGAEKE